MGTKEGIPKNGEKGFNKNEGDAQDIGLDSMGKGLRKRMERDRTIRERDYRLLWSIFLQKGIFNAHH